MAENNGDGKTISNRWMLNVVVGILVAGAGTVLGYQMKSAMPRSEVELLKQNADAIHLALFKRDDELQAQITTMMVAYMETSKALAVIQDRLERMGSGKQ